MNHSIHSADRGTHLKIVVLALVAGICIAGLGLSARGFSTGEVQAVRVLKADKPVMVTHSGLSTVR